MPATCAAQQAVQAPPGKLSLAFTVRAQDLEFSLLGRLDGRGRRLLSTFANLQAGEFDSAGQQVRLGWLVVLDRLTTLIHSHIALFFGRSRSFTRVRA